MRHYLSTADFLKLQLNSGSVFERDEVVVTDNAEQPIYTYNTSTKTWEKLSVIPATSTAVSATTNPLTGGIGLQVGGVQALAVGGLQNVTYDGSNRVIAYDTLGAAHTVTYPDATHIVDSGGGVTTTITLDGSGRITGVVRS